MSNRTKIASFAMLFAVSACGTGVDPITGGASTGAGATTGGASGGTTPPVAPAQPPAALQTQISTVASASAAASGKNANPNTSGAIPAPFPTQMLASVSASGTTSTVTKSVLVSNAVTGDNQIEVFLDGIQYIATGNVDASGNITSFTGMSPDGSKAVTITPISVSADGSVFLNSLTQNSNTDGTTLFGFNAMGTPTDPTALNARGNNLGNGLGNAYATYTGTSNIIATRDDGATDSATGTVHIDANFDQNVFDGFMNLKSPNVGTGGYDLGDVTININSGTINGSQLHSTDLTTLSTTSFPYANQLGIDDRPSAPTPQTSDLTGSVFGANGQNIAGQFTISGRTSAPSPLDPTQGIVVQGGFVGQE